MIFMIKMQFISVLTVILISLGVSYTQIFCLALRLSFAQNVVNENQIFKTFIPVTFQTCRDECDRRPRCVAVTYHRRYSMCGLASKQDTNTNDRGMVMLVGSKVNPVCGDRLCSNIETCIDDGNGIVCRVTECIEPERKFPFYYGINFNVGSSIVYRGRPQGIDLQRTCLENGEWSLDKTRVTKDCFDVTGPSGVYWQPDLDTPIFCDMVTDGGHWLVFQRRLDGSIDFFRNWETYENGFGQLHGEFWMGLSTIHGIVSNSVYKLRIDMENFQGKHGYAKYDIFSITGPQTNYTLRVVGFTGDRGDSLTGWHSEEPFSTFDHEQDQIPFTRCAGLYKGGWWYNLCHQSNLNGLYDADGIITDKYPRYIHWTSWTYHAESLKETYMKFRRHI